MCCCQQYFASHSHTLYFIFTNFNSYLVHTFSLDYPRQKDNWEETFELKIMGNRNSIQMVNGILKKPQYSIDHHCRIEFIPVYCILHLHPHIPKAAIRMTDAIRLVMNHSKCLNYLSIYPKTLCRFALSQCLFFRTWTNSWWLCVKYIDHYQ